MKWEYKTLDQLGEVSRGRSKHRPRNDPSLFGGKYPFIQTADVKAANFYITEYDTTYNEKGLAQSRLWNPGTLCITIFVYVYGVVDICHGLRAQVSRTFRQRFV